MSLIFSTRTHGIQGFALLLCLTATPCMALAEMIIGNLPLSGSWVGMSIANHSQGWKYEQAQGFTMGDTPFQLISVTLNLTLGGWGIPAFPPIADLYSDDDGFMGAHLTSLEPVLKPCFPCRIDEEDYLFLPRIPVVLQPQQTYWLLASVNDAGFYYWNASRPDQIPVGAFATAMPHQWTFFRGFWETHESLFGTQINSGYAVNGTRLPEPSTVFLVAAGLSLCSFLPQRRSSK